MDQELLEDIEEFVWTIGDMLDHEYGAWGADQPKRRRNGPRKRLRKIPSR